MKISPQARKAAIGLIDGRFRHEDELGIIIQSAINEATQPLVEALEVISKGYGAFNIDPYEHAKNCIEDAKSLAKEAIATFRATHLEDSP